MRKSKSSGSPNHTERVGQTNQAPAGQVASGGPGVMASRVKPANHFTSPAAGGSAPKGMRSSRGGE